MFLSNRIRRSSIAAISSAAVLIVVGCGDNTGLPARYPVSGTVTYKGAPVEKGSITFEPTSADARHASGAITDGSYTLTTLAENDGAMPGDYKVVIISTELDTSEIQARSKGGAAHHDEAFAKAVKTAKNLVPKKYGRSDTSGLTAKVEAKSNTLDFDLKDE
jgi:hypothetical protein